MNQILQVEEKKNNYRSSSTVDIKKIVLFFAIAILIFGAILLVQGVYSIYLRQINKTVKPNNPVIDIKEIQEASAPADEYVYPPDEDYVPTSALF